MYAAIVVVVGLPIAAIAYGVSGSLTVLRWIGAAITWIVALIAAGLALFNFLVDGTVLCGDNECHTGGAAAMAAVVTVLLVILGFKILKADSRDGGRGREPGASSGRTGGSEASNPRGRPCQQGDGRGTRYHADTVSLFMVEGDGSPEALTFLEGYLTQANAS